MKVKFDIKDGNSSHNDGVRYTVFEVKEQSEFFNDFSSKKSPAFEEHFQENINNIPGVIPWNFHLHPAAFTSFSLS